MSSQPPKPSPDWSIESIRGQSLEDYLKQVQEYHELMARTGFTQLPWTVVETNARQYWQMLQTGDPETLKAYVEDNARKLKERAGVISAAIDKMMPEAVRYHAKKSRERTGKGKTRKSESGRKKKSKPGRRPHKR